MTVWIRAKVWNAQFQRWLREAHQDTYPWWKALCLTSTDTVSAIVYFPSSAFLLVGVFSPLFVLLAGLVTLFGFVPIYNRIASESPHGQGSLAVIGDLLSGWSGKVLVLCLLGFVSTQFVFIISVSAADAAARVVERAAIVQWAQAESSLVGTLALIIALGATFLWGFKGPIAAAVVVSSTYLSLSLIVLSASLYQIMLEPEVLAEWAARLLAYRQEGQPVGRPLLEGSIAFPTLFLFTRLMLGISAFESGVAAMPLVRGWESDTPLRLEGRIHNTKRLMLFMAAVMVVLWVVSSFVTTVLVPLEAFEPNTGEARGRALEYLAGRYLSQEFSWAYQISTILMLWVAGLSAMSALVNIVPRYLPRLGMEPAWASTVRPFVVAFTLLSCGVAVAFRVDVNDRGGVPGVVAPVIVSLGAVAVTLSAWRKGQASRFYFAIVALVLGCATVVNVVEMPEGISFAVFFIGAVILVSRVSRALRPTDLRVVSVFLDEVASGIVAETNQAPMRVVANRRMRGGTEAYELYEMKEREKREDYRITPEDPLIFFEVEASDAGEGSGTLKVTGHRLGDYRVLRTIYPEVPNAIAAFLLHARDKTGQVPHVYFSWAGGNRLTDILGLLVLGEGKTAPVTDEVLRNVERDPDRRPRVHTGS